MSCTIVTGAAGFIGYRMAERLSRDGAQLVLVDHLAHFKSRAEHSQLPSAQIVDRDRFFDWLRDSRPRVSQIYHLGACARTTEFDRAYLDRVNVQFSKRIWTYCAERRVPLIYASSAATYGGGEFGYDDDESRMHRLRPLNPYGESKRIFDLWALGQEKRGLSPPTWAGFKFFNVYGFGERHKQSMSSVVLQAFDQIEGTGEIKLFRSHRRGIRDGEQKRDFILVEDVISVLEFAAGFGLTQPGLARGIYNLGTGESRSFLDLAQAVFDARGQKAKIGFIDTPAAIRDKYQYFTEACMDRLKNAGYLRAFTSLEEGVAHYLSQLNTQKTI